MFFINCLSALQGGGQTYLMHLFQYVPSDLRDKIIIVAHTYNRHLWEKFGLRMITSEWASQSILNRVLFENIQIPQLLRMERAKVYFAPGGILPERRLHFVTTVTMFRNMLPFAPEVKRRYPWGYMRVRLFLLQRAFSRSFQKADWLIFQSRYAEDVINRALPARQGKSVVIPHGIDDAFRYQPDRPFPEGVSGEYVLYVSTMNVYKAHLEVIQAWHLLRQRRVTCEKLLFIGPEYPFYANQVRALIQTLHLEDDVLLLGKVPYDKLPAYYQHAKINLFASACETFGIILLEKLAAGQPVFCSSYPPFPEIAGDAVEYFDPYHPEELANLLGAYLDDKEKRTELGRKAFQRAEQFSWQKTATETWELLSQLLRDA